MKISILIDKLQALEKDHGDIQCATTTGTSWHGDIFVNIVILKPSKKTKDEISRLGPVFVEII